ncbi:MAG: hypothetical protein DMG57_13360 [Acidobacteria bacterium]|nr:MAG: hypothetical protein DMG57_13360 [Acidobacteriota bacterium]
MSNLGPRATTYCRRLQSWRQHSELKAIGVPSVAVRVDVTKRAGLEPALNRVEREIGGIGILVNNAGNVSLSGGVLHEKSEDWDSVIETQLNAVSFFRNSLPDRCLVAKVERLLTLAVCIRSLDLGSSLLTAQPKERSSN